MKDPQKLTIALWSVDPASPIPCMHLHGHLHPLGDGAKRLPYAGIATLPDGRYLSSFIGNIPSHWIKARRRGRPRNEGAKVAFALHELLVIALSQDDGIARKALRTNAARAMRVGGASDADAEKYIRTEAKHESARKALEDHRWIMMFAGDDDGDGRLILAIRKDALLQRVPEGLRLAGYVWICQWGKKKAEYGRGDWLIPINKPAPDIDEIVAELSRPERTGGGIIRQ